MSINETKFRKGYVETPELRTDNIKFLGQDYPLFDVVSQSFVPNPTEFEKEFAVASSYANTLVGGIRILTHNPVYENSGLLTLTEISLFTHQRTGNNQVPTGEIIVLCVYYKRDNNYIFIGNSSNPYVNPNTAQQLTFKFDNLKLYQVINENEYLPYSEIYIKPLRVRIDAFDPTKIGNTSWDNNDNMTNLMLKGCAGSSFSYNPYVTSLDGSFSPHLIFKYKSGSFSVNDRIPHNMNGDVHLTAEEKRQVEAVCNMSNLIFDENSSEYVKSTVDTRTINSSYSRTNPETMCSIEIVPTDYVGKRLSEIYIRRADGGQTARYMNQKYLQADCYGENGQLITTKFSTNYNSQFNGDNNETGFQFSNFEILPEYKKIEFRISESNTTRQDLVYLSFVGGSLRNSANGSYRIKDGWILKWLDGAPASGENPSAQNNMSPDFSLVFEERNLIIGTGIVNHITNNSIHITDEQKEKLNSIDSLTTRISDIETSIGDNGSISQDIEELSGNISAHISDNVKHITAQERTTWNNKLSSITAGNGIEITDNTISVITTDVIEESDKIPTANALYNTFYGTRTFNNYDTSKYTESADTVGTIVLSKKHFIKEGKITKFAIPHDKNIDNGEGGHLVIEVFAEDSSKAEGYDKANPIHRYYSDNYYAYKMNTQYGKYEWTFNDTECLIPSDYKVVHLSLVTSNTVVPSIGSSNNNKFRINCLAKNGDRDEGVVYEEDDECTLYWKGNDNPNVGGANRVAIVQLEYIGNKLDDFSIVPMLLERIAALEAKVSELENS